MIILGILIKIIETILPLHDANMNLCLFISHSHILCVEGKKEKIFDKISHWRVYDHKT